ncbi:hypothetical protein Goklo_001771 [Gossypium klotzschianum]|uniref:RING-type domain-containing protein n=1 Tax=Gossypium klotzschianum TaxID=34286 RepID=A0A7J8W1F7_9ROSI|nr:hypothetical protein [Gossypium klotzschianum]
MDGGSAKCNVVFSGNNDISVPFDHHFDLDDAMTMPENLLTRHQTVVRLVSDMPTVKQATGSCSICMESLSEFEGDGSRRVLCGHVYHHDCITDWLLNGNSNSCPICRHEIRDFMTAKRARIAIQKPIGNTIMVIDMATRYLPRTTSLGFRQTLHADRATSGRMINRRHIGDQTDHRLMPGQKVFRHCHSVVEVELMIERNSNIVIA